MDESHIRAEIRRNDIDHRIDMHLRKNKNKGVAIDMLPLKKSAELFGMINIIFFSPEDLSIIKNGPAERRRFVDMELCQLDKIYLNDLSTYNKILNQRNNQLKTIYFNPKSIDMLDIWDAQIVDCGKKIIKKRNEFIDDLNDVVRDIHEKLTGGKEKLCIRYEKNVEETAYDELIKEKRDIDLKYQNTSVGPHRDDIAFFVNDIDVKKYGSQGQQRTVALSLKLAEIELVKRKIDDNPVLLLDDVMSELDSKRRDALLTSIADIQTIITCTGYDDFIKERISIDRIYRVTAGNLREEMSSNE
jgi:DNA replication and repair protein RecF